MYEVGNYRGIVRVASYVRSNTAPCDVLNGSGDAQKYAYSLGPNRITNYASGPRALAYGIRYFFLNPKDAVARYGVMTPDLEAWIRMNGVPLASLSSLPDNVSIRPEATTRVSSESIVRGMRT